MQNFICRHDALSLCFRFNFDDVTEREITMDRYDALQTLVTRVCFEFLLGNTTVPSRNLPLPMVETLV